MKINSTSVLLAMLVLVSSSSMKCASTEPAQASPAAFTSSSSFPGVSRDLSSFCAARPSLPIDLATMIVHVKRNVSFNYKLYLLSTDNVFQTGQVIPRDDFRIHSFPVKLKQLNKFWPANVATFEHSGGENGALESVPSSTFSLKQFMRNVPIVASKPAKSAKSIRRGRKVDASEPKVPEDASADFLPGEDNSKLAENINKHIDFDRDDQVSVVRRAYSARYLAGDQLETESEQSPRDKVQEFAGNQLIPVGSFSSFHVNSTYLVRKDFDQQHPELVRILVDADQFQVTQLQLINYGLRASANYPRNDDYDFLSHKLLVDPNTRITSINQIYEDWITRNFYTIVYIQRKLEAPDLDELEGGESKEPTIVNDRLIFRGSSTALLGADHLDYTVKAAAFITEKNGLHYYLEFLTSSKFYLCAVDWTKRPFKIIDSRQMPIKATRTQLDNEELLLCPPAVCYSNQPIDEVVAYGRIKLSDQIQADLMLLSSSSNSTSKFKSKSYTYNSPPVEVLNETALIYSRNHKKLHLTERNADLKKEAEADSLAELVKEIKSGSSELQTRLHLRDWLWPMSRTTNKDSLFGWRYESAKRNDIKVRQDSYGYALTGHDIDASYRVFNELYLVSVSSC